MIIILFFFVGFRELGGGDELVHLLFLVFLALFLVIIYEVGGHARIIIFNFHALPGGHLFLILILILF